MIFYTSLFALAALAAPPAPAKPSMNDYQALQVALGEFVTPETIPKLVRMSFHDLINFDKTTGKGAAQGCIFDQRVAAFNENNGLNATAQALQGFIAAKFPNVAFSSGRF